MHSKHATLALMVLVVVLATSDKGWTANAQAGLSSGLFNNVYFLAFVGVPAALLLISYIVGFAASAALNSDLPKTLITYFSVRFVILVEFLSAGVLVYVILSERYQAPLIDDGTAVFTISSVLLTVLVIGWLLFSTRKKDLF
jgi:hypothetical protein